MKRILVFVSCIFVLFASCKKDKQQAPSNYVTADIDGVTFNFTSNNLASLRKATTTEKNKLYVYGATAIDENADAISLTASVTQTIVKGGTYTGSSDDNQYVGISYIAGPFSATQDNEFISDYSDGGVAITVTSLTDTEIQGTFRGQIANNGHVKRVTNGKFKLALNY